MKIDWIVDGVLAAGGILIWRADIESLHEQGIRAIITLTEYPLTIRSELTPDLFERLDIECLHVPVPDQFSPSEEQVAEVLQYIEQMQVQSKPVYIHCYAGHGRTGTMLHCYFLGQGCSLVESQSAVKARRVSSEWLMLSDMQKAFLMQYAETLKPI